MDTGDLLQLARDQVIAEHAAVGNTVQWVAGHWLEPDPSTGDMKPASEERAQRLDREAQIRAQFLRNDEIQRAEADAAVAARLQQAREQVVIVRAAAGQSVRCEQGQWLVGGPGGQYLPARSRMAGNLEAEAQAYAEYSARQEEEVQAQQARQQEETRAQALAEWQRRHPHHRLYTTSTGRRWVGGDWRTRGGREIWTRAARSPRNEELLEEYDALLAEREAPPADSDGPPDRGRLRVFFEGLLGGRIRRRAEGAEEDTSPAAPARTRRWGRRIRGTLAGLSRGRGPATAMLAGLLAGGVGMTGAALGPLTQAGGLAVSPLGGTGQAAVGIGTTLLQLLVEAVHTAGRIGVTVLGCALASLCASSIIASLGVLVTVVAGAFSEVFGAVGRAVSETITNIAKAFQDLIGVGTRLAETVANVAYAGNQTIASSTRSVSYLNAFGITPQETERMFGGYQGSPWLLRARLGAFGIDVPGDRRNLDMPGLIRSARRWYRSQNEMVREPMLQAAFPNVSPAFRALLNMPEEQFRRMEQGAREAELNAGAMQQLREQLMPLTNLVRQISNALRVDILSALIPLFTAVLGGLVSLWEANREKLRTWLAEQLPLYLSLFGEWLARMLEGLATAWPHIMRTLTELWQLFERAAGAIKRAVDWMGGFWGEMQRGFRGEPAGGGGGGGASEGGVAGAGGATGPQAEEGGGAPSLGYRLGRVANWARHHPYLSAAALLLGPALVSGGARALGGLTMRGLGTGLRGLLRRGAVAAAEGAAGGAAGAAAEGAVGGAAALGWIPRLAGGVGRAGGYLRAVPAWLARTGATVAGGWRGPALDAGRAWSQRLGRWVAAPREGAQALAQRAGWRGAGDALRAASPQIAWGGAHSVARGVLGGAGSAFLAGEITGALWSNTRLGRSVWGSAGMGIGSVLAGAALGSRYGPAGTIAGAVAAPVTALYRYGMATRRQRLAGEAVTREVARTQAGLMGLSEEAWDAMSQEQKAWYIRRRRPGVRAQLEAAGRPTPQERPGGFLMAAARAVRGLTSYERLKQAMYEAQRRALDESTMKAEIKQRVDVYPQEMARAIELFETERNIRAVWAALA